MLSSLDDLTPSEQVALAYCGPRGVPISVFLGRVVGHGESLWLPRDAQAAVLWQNAEAGLCSGCGQPKRESMRDEVAPSETDDGPEYEVTVTRCRACETRDARMAEFREGEGGGSPSGLYLSVSRKAG